MVSTPSKVDRSIQAHVGSEARLFSATRPHSGTVYGHTGNYSGYTQFAAAILDGNRSVTASVTEQLQAGLHPTVFGQLLLVEP
jgi:hypothetical protein